VAKFEMFVNDLVATVASEIWHLTFFTLNIFCVTCTAWAKKKRSCGHFLKLTDSILLE